MALRAIQQFRQKEFRQLKLGLPPRRPLTEFPASRPGIPRIPNPFLAWKNPKTECWIPPRYSLRQQADLVKQARISGVLHMLPPGPKLLNPEHAAVVQMGKTRSEDLTIVTRRKWVRLKKLINQHVVASGVTQDPAMRPVDWDGKFDGTPKPGADLGTRLYAAKKKMFKGHRHERLAVRKVVYRKILLRDMNRRIEQFRQVRCLGYSTAFSPCSDPSTSVSHQEEAQPFGGVQGQGQAQEGQASILACLPSSLRAVRVYNVHNPNFCLALSQYAIISALSLSSRH